MESPGYASSTEAHPKQSSPHKSTASDYTEKTTHLRFLVSNAEAGSVIGKGGSAIAEFQSKSGARIQLSRNYECFPGTSDRIIMISGTVDDIFKAVELILDKLLNEFCVEDGDNVDPRTKLRLVVPNSSCGGIIGKGGANIKSFIEGSQAGIKISPQDNNYVGLTDRLVTLTGTLEEQMRATDLILLKLCEDPYYSQSFIGLVFTSRVRLSLGEDRVEGAGKKFEDENQLERRGILSRKTDWGTVRMTKTIPPKFRSTAHNAMNYGPNGGRFQNRRFQDNKEDRSTSMTIGVADEHIGIVVGRGGRNIVDITQVSGARIKISDRGDFIPGTSERKVSISGSQKAIRVAETMILNKVSYAAEIAAATER
ncbi:hypothetical protein RJ639_015406 [Escallonia herrerae]|uniref:K Homology domain-containing protein n=1 Tax=Escallonia herrerae TaxID=1293975 RepID=A0AA88VIN0_9ASTE|nr:hypothetical protein RJ639_015406 [Escallonia herrerae]